jgi:hypothetical protein
MVPTGQHKLLTQFIDDYLPIAAAALPARVYAGSVERIVDYAHLARNVAATDWNIADLRAQHSVYVDWTVQVGVCVFV